MNHFLETLAKPFENLAPWLLRLSLGISFVIHGASKFPLPPEKMVTWFESMNIAFPEAITSLVALGEVVAGIGIIIGGFIPKDFGSLITRLSGGAVMVIMAGAFYLAHSDWFITTKLFTSEQIFLFIIGTYFAIKGNN